jgi:hypothetical protein
MAKPNKVSSLTFIYSFPLKITLLLICIRGLGSFQEVEHKALQIVRKKTQIIFVSVYQLIEAGLGG